MKKTIYKVLLIVLIVIHVATPLVKLAAFGYEVPELISDVYNNGVIIILSAAVLYLYNSK